MVVSKELPQMPLALLVVGGMANTDQGSATSQQCLFVWGTLLHSGVKVHPRAPPMRGQCPTLLGVR